MNYREYGFKNESSKVFHLFLNIPIFPEVITVKELSNRAHITSQDARNLIEKLPTNAPVFQDDSGKLISRIK